MAEIERVIYRLEAEVGDLRRSIENVRTDVEKTGKTIVNLGTTVEGTTAKMAAGFGSLRGAIALLGVKELVADFVRTNVQFQAITNTLKFVTGSAEGAAKEFGFVRTTAKQLGLDLQSAAAAYGSIQAAAKGSTVSQEQVRQVFLGISEAGAALGLSAEQVEGSLLAVQQMISKGTVSSEELRGQLGERLPGAFQAAARAMGVTTGELGKLLEQGLVPTSEFLPKFAAQLRSDFGDAAEAASGSAAAAINNFNTALFDLKITLGDSGVFDTFTTFVSGLGAAISFTADKLKAFDAAIVGWIASGNVVGTKLDEQRAKVDELNASIAAVNAQLAARRPGSGGYDDLVKQLGSLQGEADKAAAELLMMDDAVAAGRAEREAATAALQADIVATVNAVTAKGKLTAEEQKAQALAERRSDTLGDLNREAEQLTALAAAYKGGNAEAIHLVETTIKIDETLHDLDLTRLGDLSSELAKATLNAEDLQNQVDAAKALLDFQQQTERSEKLADAFRSGGEKAEFLAEKVADVDDILRDLNIDPASELGQELQAAGLAAAEAEQNLNDLKNTAKDVGEETKRQAQKQADETARLINRPFENFVDSLQSSTTRVFRNILSGGVTTFSDLFSTATDLALDFAAQLATLAVFNPSAVFGGPAPGASNLGGSIAPTLPGMFGGATLGSVGPDALFGAGNTSTYGSVPAGPLSGLADVSVAGLATSGLLGFAGGQFLAPMLGLNQTGGGVGGGIGAAAGFALGGPLGALGGGLLGTLAGGFLGNAFQKPQDNNAQFQFDVGTGAVSPIVGKNADPANIQITQQIGQAGLDFVDQLKKLGAEFGDVSLEIKAGLESGFNVRTIDNATGQSTTRTAGSADELNLVALRALIDASSGGLTDEQRRIATASKATDAQGLIADIQLPDLIKSLIDPTNRFKAAIDELRATYKDAETRAKALGVSTDGLSEARDREIAKIRAQQKISTLTEKFDRQNTLINAGVSQVTPESAAVIAIRQQFLILRARADELGVSLRQLDAAEARQIKAVREQVRAQVEAERQARITETVGKARGRSDTLFDLGITDISDERRQIINVQRQYADARRIADELGVSIGDINRAERERIQSIKDAAKALREQEREQRQAAIDNARDQIVSSVQGVLGTFDNLISPLVDFQRQAATSDFVSGGPQAQLDAARKQFTEAQVAVGTDGATDQEVSDLASLGQQVIDLSRKVNASSPEFFKEFNQVVATVGDAQKEIERDRNSFLKSLPEEFRSAATAEINELKAQTKVIQKQLDSFDQLARDMRDFLRRRVA